MNTNAKRALLIFGGGVLLFWAFKKISPFGGKMKNTPASKSNSNFVPTQEQVKNGALVVKAYEAAQNAGEPKQFLDEMNTQFASQYGLRVYSNKKDGKLFAADLEGNKIS
jgi:hypothetical protein